jgi:hypothetical protein
VFNLSESELRLKRINHELTNAVILVQMNIPGSIGEKAPDVLIPTEGVFKHPNAVRLK